MRLDLESSAYTDIGLDGYMLHDISPDGSRILVSQSGSLYIRELDGLNSIEISDAFDDSVQPAAYWSAPDEIIFIADYEGLNAIYRIKPDGTGLQRITEKKQVLELHPAFDNTGVFWSEGFEDRRGLFNLGEWWSNKGGDEHIKLDYSILKFSPTGQSVTYVNEYQPDMQLYIAVTNGSNEFENIGIYSSTLRKNNNDSSLIAMINPRASFISPDEEKIIVGEEICSPTCDQFSYFLVSPDGTVITKLPEEIGRIWSIASWSPDSHLLFYSMTSPSEWNLIPTLLNLDTMEVTTYPLEIFDDENIVNIIWIPNGN